jgi:flagellar motor switch protein FliG
MGGVSSMKNLVELVLNQIEKDMDDREVQPLELMIEGLVKLDNEKVTDILTSFLSEEGCI